MRIHSYCCSQPIDFGVMLAQLQEYLYLEPGPLDGISRVYYDSFDWRLYNKGYSLWLDRTGASNALKLATHAGEFVCTCLGYAGCPDFRQSLPTGTMADKLGPILGVRRLLAQLEVTGRQQSVQILDRQGRLVIRLLLQNWWLAPEGQDAPEQALHSRVRLLPLQEASKTLRRSHEVLENQLGLRLQSQSLLEEGLAQQHRQPGDYATKVQAQDDELSAGEASRQLLWGLLEVMQRNEAGAREATDSEFVHDLRVACRRSRTALSQIRGVFTQDTIDYWQQQLRWLGSITGEVRDLDVYLLEFEQHRAQLPAAWQSSLDPLQAYLQQRQQQARQQLAHDLDSQPYRQLQQQWQAFLEQPPASAWGPRAGEPAGDVARDSIWRAYKKVRKQGRKLHANSEPEAFHELRKSCKKLRYLLEFFQPLLPPKKAAKSIKALKKLQDQLGLYQDLTVQQQKLRDMAHQLAAEQQGAPDTLLAMGMLLAAKAHRQQQVQAGFAAQFAAFDRSKVQQRFAALCGRH